MPDKTTPIEKATAAAGDFIYQGPEPQPMELRLRARDCARAVLSTTLEPSEEECEAALDAYIDAGSFLTTEAMRAALIAAAKARTGE